MSEPTLWWLLAGALVAVELATGTFYLLMLAMGVACAAIGAHLGLGLTGQMVVASVVGGGAVALWHVKKGSSKTEQPAQSNTNVLLDIGETVTVNAWNADGTANVHYRGANWTAIHRAGVTPTSGLHRVAELVGNRLLVDKA